MTAKTVLSHRHGGVRVIELNRPDKLNAFNAELLAEFQNALDEAERDNDTRVVVVKGAGRAFSVGMDIEGGNTPKELGVTGDRQRLQKIVEGFLRVWDFPKPVVAQVHGYCCGVGTILALACDITFVSRECKLRFPSIPIGGGFVSCFWTFFVGPKRAKEMDFVAGSEISGAEAEDWGWANRSFPEVELEQRAMRLAEVIGRTPPDLLRLKKLAINRVAEWQGFRQAMLSGAEWDTLCHFSNGATEMRQRIVDLGLKAAIKSLQGA